MKDYISDFTTLLVKEVLYNTLKQEVNLSIKENTKTSTVEVDLEPISEVSKYYLENYFSKGVAIEEDIKVRVFDISDIDWEIAERDIFLSLNWNDLKIGEVNEMEEIVRKLINMSSQNKTLTWLNELFLKHNRNALFVCSLFHVLSHMEYEEVMPQGPTMAMAALNHVDDRVMGYAIKAFSNWNSKTTLGYMKVNVPNIPWAQKEWKRVIEHIEEFGDADNELLNENDWSNETMDTRTGRNFG